MGVQGTSLLVPCVKELAKEPIMEVPERYVRLDQDPPTLSNTTSFSQVPVIDLHKLLSQDATELERLNHACKQWGFFQYV
ncbi:Protein SRG1, partial [Mucuna pruriens]